MDITTNKIFMKQVTKEIELVGIEAKNQYNFFDEQEQHLFSAYEDSSTMGRNFLNSFYNYKFHFVDKENNKLFSFKKERRYGIWYPKYTIFDTNDANAIGLVKEKFSIFSTKFSIDNKYTLKNSPVHPWTFNLITKDRTNNTLATITKKFSGVMKEAFTDSDNFIIDFKNTQDLQMKKIILCLSVIVDMTKFEKSAQD